MLITNNNLNIEEFKQLVPTLQWTKYPRKLGTDHVNYFYIGMFENDEKEIKVVVKPSLWMSVTENFKNRKHMDGSIPEEGYKGQLVDWGYYVEVQVEESFLAKVKELSSEPVSKAIQKVSW